MKRLFPMFVAFALTTAGLRAGWVTAEGFGSIGCALQKSGGYATLDEALKELAEKGKISGLESINISLFFRDADFEKELAAALERDAPREWKEALKSVGNMHNPKMYQLWEPLKKAALTTAAVKKVNAALLPYGLVCNGASTEELELPKVADRPREFYGLLWLKVGKIPMPK